MSFMLTSPAFDDHGAIPEKFARDGENVSPPLEWSGAPEATKSFALIVEDPDAPSGMFRHWAVYNIPPIQHRLKEGEDVKRLGEATNDFGERGYDGPQPPKGHGVHHYHFRLAALDVDRLEDAKPANSVAQVWEKARPHILAETELVGVYERGR